MRTCLLLDPTKLLQSVNLLLIKLAFFTCNGPVDRGFAGPFELMASSATVDHELHALFFVKTPIQCWTVLRPFIITLLLAGLGRLEQRRSRCASRREKLPNPIMEKVINFKSNFVNPLDEFCLASDVYFCRPLTAEDVSLIVELPLPLL